MKAAPDTNVLIRAVVEDDAKQARAARHLLSNADSIAISLPCFCEFAWVLGTVYKMDKLDIAAAIETYIQARNVVTDHPAVDAGLAMLYAGGDFADGVLAFEGRRLGADVFVSFDKEAVRLLARQGLSAKLLS
jgi:predicted nucleic-acid-binding protein